jgi:cytochrome P450 family 144
MVLTSYFNPTTLENPYPFFAWLRAEAPVWRVPETGHWLVSRYAEVKRVCLAPEVFSSRLAAVVTRDDAGAVQLLDTGVADTPQGSVLGVADGAAHLRHRQAALRTFTPRFLRTLEQLMRDVARERVNVCVRAPHFCGVRELARPIPRRLMCLLLGLPIEDEERLEAWSDAAIALMGGIPSLAELARGALSVAEFEAYVATWCLVPQGAPTDRWRPAPADSPSAPATSVSPLVRARIEGCSARRRGEFHRRDPGRTSEGEDTLTRGAAS